MSLYLKRLVSGNKARYRDDLLNIELDLAYVTDQIIVMGFPAVGLEGIYRNHRADVQRFLSTRHGSDFWVFNFCPLQENIYHDSVFQGRVSRYPFPDHHVPPFLYLTLVTREMNAWLSGSDTRVAVLHCKAGKGRSGILACAYLLFVSTSPRSLQYSKKWSLTDGQEPQEPLAETSQVVTSGRPPVHPASIPSGIKFNHVPSEPVINMLEKVLDFHTSRRMKLTPTLARRNSDASSSKRPKMGVSIPSQQRWLFYWSQVLDGRGPLGLRPSPRKEGSQSPEMTLNTTLLITKVKLVKLTVRMWESSMAQPPFAQTVGGLWASLARYNDELIDELEHWEQESHNPTKTSPFKNDRWDKAKMIHDFAQMILSDVSPIPEGGNERPIITYVLRPEAELGLHWPIPDLNHGNPPPRTSISDSSSYALVSLTDDPSGILLDANRELRIKLFMGKVTLGWIWIIPRFHVSPDSLSSELVLSSGDVDFATGVGKGLIDMKISFACHGP